MAYSVREFELCLSEAIAEAEAHPSAEELNRRASGFLVPKEYELARQQGCAKCGSSRLRMLEQSTIPPRRSDPAAWPYSCPAGDRLIFLCGVCGEESEFIFRFRK
jgi:hypothetical protein